jgi:hypothetical protein
MKQFILAIYLFTVASGVFAQKEALKSLCADYEQRFVKNTTFQLSYTLTVASSLDTTKESMKFDLYKSGDKDCAKIGDSQVMIHDGTFFLLVNHEVHTIRINNDSSNLNSKNMLVSSFTSIIDSSSNIQYQTKDNKIYYTVLFPSSYVYSKIEFVFSKKTKSLIYIYALFSETYPSEFKFIEVDYSEPDFKWKPAADFPGTGKYVQKTNGRYVIQEAFDSYKTY